MAFIRPSFGEFTQHDEPREPWLEPGQKSHGFGTSSHLAEGPPHIAIPVVFQGDMHLDDDDGEMLDSAISSSCAGDVVKDNGVANDTRDLCRWLEKALAAERNSIQRYLKQQHGNVIRDLQHRLAALQKPTQMDAAKSLPKLLRSPAPSREDSEKGAASTKGTLVDSGSSDQPKQVTLQAALGDRFCSKQAPDWSRTSSYFNGTLSSPEMHWFTSFVTGPAFEAIFGMLIILNTAVLALQMQYDGFDNDFALKYSSSARPATETWPGAAGAFNVSEWIFGTIFALEVILKAFALRKRFFADSYWNAFDVFVVLVWLFDRVTVTQFGLRLNSVILRLGRLCRLVRLIRIVRWMSIFAPLTLLVKSIRASVSVLVWSLLLMIIIISIIGMFVSEMLQPYIQDNSNDLETRIEVFKSWGTFTRAMVSMFEITLANWGPPCRFLMDHVNEWWAFFFLFYKCSIGFAVVQVITSVFIQQTFKVASHDEEVMIQERNMATKAYLKNLERLFQVLDESGDGIITQEEFESVLDDKRVRNWFAAIEVDVGEASELFHILDDGDGQIELNDFIRGMKTIKGFAKGTDMWSLMVEIKGIKKSICHIQHKMGTNGVMGATLSSASRKTSRPCRVASGQTDV